MLPLKLDRLSRSIAAGSDDSRLQLSSKFSMTRRARINNSHSKAMDRVSAYDLRQAAKYISSYRVIPIEKLQHPPYVWWFTNISVLIQTISSFIILVVNICLGIDNFNPDPGVQGADLHLFDFQRDSIFYFSLYISIVAVITSLLRCKFLYQAWRCIKQKEPSVSYINESVSTRIAALMFITLSIINIFIFWEMSYFSTEPAGRIKHIMNMFLVNSVCSCLGLLVSAAIVSLWASLIFIVGTSFAFLKYAAGNVCFLILALIVWIYAQDTEFKANLKEFNDQDTFQLHLALRCLMLSTSISAAIAIGESCYTIYALFQRSARLMLYDALCVFMLLGVNIAFGNSGLYTKLILSYLQEKQDKEMHLVTLLGFFKILTTLSTISNYVIFISCVMSLLLILIIFLKDSFRPIEWYS